MYSLTRDRNDMLQSFHKRPTWWLFSHFIQKVAQHGFHQRVRKWTYLWIAKSYCDGLNSFGQSKLWAFI